MPLDFCWHLLGCQFTRSLGSFPDLFTPLCWLLSWCSVVNYYRNLGKEKNKRGERSQWKPKLSALERFNKGVTKENCSWMTCRQDDSQRFGRESLKLDSLLNLHHRLKFSLFCMEIMDNCICGFCQKDRTLASWSMLRKGPEPHQKIAGWHL